MDRPRSARMEEWRSRAKGTVSCPNACLLATRVNSEWIHVRLAFVESLDGFKGFCPGKFTSDDEIIVNHCGLEPLFIQVRSERVTLSSSNRKIPRFHGFLSVSVKDVNPICPVSLSALHIIGRLNCKSLFAGSLLWSSTCSIGPTSGCSEELFSVPKSGRVFTPQGRSHTTLLFN